MPSNDEDLFHHIGELLWPQHGWSLEPSPTPGGPSSWCYEHHGRVTLFVGVDDGRITLYLPEHDRDLTLETIDQLSVWLEENKASFIKSE
jgi:hypothetical protein